MKSAWQEAPMTTAAIQSKALMATPGHAEAPPTLTMMAVARKYGLSPYAQMREAVSLRFGPGRIGLTEYYSSGLFDPDIAPGAKREYVGYLSSREINDRLSPPGLTATRAFLRDRVMYGSLLERLGLAAVQTQAVAVRGRGFGTIPTLTSAAELQDFLRKRAEFPIFGTSCFGGGSVLIAGIDGDRLITGTGRRISLEAFCGEILAERPEGFILQSALDQHADLSRVIGAALGVLRVVTVRDDDTPKVLYTVWKIPAPPDTGGDFGPAGGMFAAIDVDGRVGRCHRGAGVDGHWIVAHPATGEKFDGQRIPCNDDLRRLACQAHALFPEFGIVGWDVAITPQGPVIVRANDDPQHMLWQSANGRGFRNAGFVPLLAAAAEMSRDIRDRQRARGRGFRPGSG
jgi:hypothetical protein